MSKYRMMRKQTAKAAGVPYRLPTTQQCTMRGDKSACGMPARRTIPNAAPCYYCGMALRVEAGLKAADASKGGN